MKNVGRQNCLKCVSTHCFLFLPFLRTWIITFFQFCSLGSDQACPANCSSHHRPWRPLGRIEGIDFCFLTMRKLQIWIFPWTQNGTFQHLCHLHDEIIATPFSKRPDWHGTLNCPSHHWKCLRQSNFVSHFNFRIWRSIEFGTCEWQSMFLVEAILHVWKPKLKTRNQNTCNLNDKKPLSNFGFELVGSSVLAALGYEYLHKEILANWCKKICRRYVNIWYSNIFKQCSENPWTFDPLVTPCWILNPC